MSVSTITYSRKTRSDSQRKCTLPPTHIWQICYEFAEFTCVDSLLFQTIDQYRVFLLGRCVSANTSCLMSWMSRPGTRGGRRTGRRSRLHLSLSERLCRFPVCQRPYSCSLKDFEIFIVFLLWLEDTNHYADQLPAHFMQWLAFLGNLVFISTPGNF